MISAENILFVPVSVLLEIEPNPFDDQMALSYTLTLKCTKKLPEKSSGIFIPPYALLHLHQLSLINSCQQD